MIELRNENSSSTIISHLSPFVTQSIYHLASITGQSTIAIVSLPSVPAEWAITWFLLLLFFLVLAWWRNTDSVTRDTRSLHQISRSRIAVQYLTLFSFEAAFYFILSSFLFFIFRLTNGFSLFGIAVLTSTSARWEFGMHVSIGTDGENVGVVCILNDGIEMVLEEFDKRELIDRHSEIWRV